TADAVRLTKLRDIDGCACRIGRRGTNWYCLLFDSLAFEVFPIAEDTQTAWPYIVVRPSHQDGNFLWPFLSDLEFTFFVVFCIATFAGYFWSKRRR
ncbi:MAG: hypothetical protein AAFY56_14820, partial [Pseudomonadota bacterium]